MDLMRFNHLATKFVSHDEYQYLLDYSKKMNFFDIFDMTDDQHTSMLAWLLNPAEGHGLGDRFLKEYIVSAYNTYNSLKESGENQEKVQSIESLGLFNGDFNPYHIFMGQLGGAKVFTDIPAGEGVFDIVVVIDDIKSAIVINNSFDSDNISMARSFVSIPGLSENYKMLYCNQDFDLTDAKLPMINKHWLSFDYSVTQLFLENIVDREIVPEKINTFFKDYLQMLDGDYTTSKLHKNIEESLGAFFEENHELISYFKDLEIDGKKVSDFSETEWFNAMIRGNNVELSFFYKHFDVLSELFDSINPPA